MGVFFSPDSPRARALFCNGEIYRSFPGAFTVAEESTALAGVTRPVHLGGPGFGIKWDMGWMNDPRPVSPWMGR